MRDFAAVLLASDSMCRLRFFRRWALGPLDERARAKDGWTFKNEARYSFVPLD
jgi:hypothetical protein